jgi:hypothetical protein
VTTPCSVETVIGSGFRLRESARAALTEAVVFASSKSRPTPPKEPGRTFQ